MNDSNQANLSEIKIKPDYAHHAKLWVSSSLNQHEYCRVNNLSYGRFVTERSKLLSKQGKTRKQNTKGKFVQLQAQPKIDIPSVNNTDSIVLRLAKGSIIELPASLSAEQLELVFKSLGNVL